MTSASTPKNRRRTFQKAELISTDRLVLEKVTTADAKALYAQINDETVLNTLTISHMNEHEWLKFIRYTEAQWKMNNDFTYTIKLLPQQIPIGQVSIYHLSFVHLRGEIGIWLGKDYHRQGLGRETLQEVIHYAFSILGLNRLEVHIFTFNEASRHLFEEQGFICEGRLQEYIRKGDQFLDVFEMALTRRHWEH